MAGLFAAHVLSEHFDEVLVVDRDQLVGASGLRRTTPQSFHAHALLARGQRAVEALYPGITKEFAADGVPVGDVGRDLRWVVNGRRLRPVETGLVALATPRITLEDRIREKAAALANVTFLEYTDVLRLTATPDGRRITGAVVRPSGAGGGGGAAPDTGARDDDARDAGTRELAADLVVDTTGRGSRLSAWLGELGYPQPAEQRMRIALGYATQHYRMPVGLLGSDLAYIIVQTPAFPRGAVLARERLLPDGGERYTLSLNGHLDQRPPADREAFMAYVRSLPVPHVHDCVRDAEPLDDIRTYQFPATLWRHYERLDRFPECLLAMGDSVASPNPVYAQGNTISAVEALILREHLRGGAVPKAARFFTDISRIIASAWDVNIAGDIGHPGIEGPLTFKTRAASRYLPLVQRAAVHDAAVNEAFLRVAGLIDEPQALMTPRRMLRVLRGAARRSTG
jgi:hypothetical protein